MPTCMFQVPNKGSMDQSHQIGKLQHMASINNQSHKQVFPEAEETQKGRVRHTRQGLISTREKTQVFQPAANGKIINIPPKNHYNIYVKVTDMKHTIYTYHTENFPVTSRIGHKYLMIMCEVDINTILSDPMKTQN